MAVILHLVRHAVAEHNITQDYSIPDPPLTPHGRDQATKLNTEQNIQQTAELIVTSPLTRALQTTIIGFPALRARLEAQAEPKGIIILSRLQETGGNPCDSGRPREELERIDEFSGIDFSDLEDDWTSKKGKFHPEVDRERAKWVRKWLRDRPEKEIVVVAHAGILGMISGTSVWDNCEGEHQRQCCSILRRDHFAVRQYTFKSADDEEADIIPIKAEASVGLGPASCEQATSQ